MLKFEAKFKLDSTSRIQFALLFGIILFVEVRIYTLLNEFDLHQEYGLSVWNQGFVDNEFISKHLRGMDDAESNFQWKRILKGTGEEHENGHIYESKSVQSNHEFELPLKSHVNGTDTTMLKQFLESAKLNFGRDAIKLLGKHFSRNDLGNTLVKHINKDILNITDSKHVQKISRGDEHHSQDAKDDERQHKNRQEVRREKEAATIRKDKNGHDYDGLVADDDSVNIADIQRATDEEGIDDDDHHNLGTQLEHDRIDSSHRKSKADSKSHIHDLLSHSPSSKSLLPSTWSLILVVFIICYAVAGLSCIVSRSRSAVGIDPITGFRVYSPIQAEAFDIGEVELSNKPMKFLVSSYQATAYEV